MKQFWNSWLLQVSMTPEHALTARGLMMLC
jgi:hypothetical protein